MTIEFRILVRQHIVINYDASVLLRKFNIQITVKEKLRCTFNHLHFPKNLFYNKIERKKL